jgi:hypothetical protein
LVIEVQQVLGRMACRLLFGTSVKNGGKAIDGWRIRGFMDWMIAILSFGVFLALEAGLVYAYYVALTHMRF